MVGLNYARNIGWHPLALIALLAAGIPAAALGALGGNDDSVEADRAQLRASGRLVASAAYIVHDLQASTGTLVHEYLSTDGVVFAITWSGPFKPDLRQVLGSYFEDFRQAPRTAEANSRRAHRIEHGELIVQSGGRPRAFFGRAWVPRLVPAGVNADELP
jgi:hypothetical protein